MALIKERVPVRRLRYLWIDAGKTANARRHLEVPEIMQPYLLRPGSSRSAASSLAAASGGSATGGLSLRRLYSGPPENAASPVRGGAAGVPGRWGAGGLSAQPASCMSSGGQARRGRSSWLLRALAVRDARRDPALSTCAERRPPAAERKRDQRQSPLTRTGGTEKSGAERSATEKSSASARFLALASRTDSGGRSQRHSIIFRMEV